MWGNNYGGYYPMPGTNGYNYPSGGNVGGNMPQQNPNGQVPATPMTWVAGVGEVEATYVAPGTAAAFWDSNANIIYLKAVDNTGRPSVRKLRWEEYVDTPPTVQPAFDPNEYLTKREFEAWAKSITQQTQEGNLNDG